MTGPRGGTQANDENSLSVLDQMRIISDQMQHGRLRAEDIVNHPPEDLARGKHAPRMLDEQGSSSWPGRGTGNDLGTGFEW